MCSEYNIVDLAEFTFDRVSHAAPEDMNEASKQFQLFDKEVYCVQNMNPF